MSSSLAVCCPEAGRSFVAADGAGPVLERGGTSQRVARAATSCAAGQGLNTSGTTRPRCQAGYASLSCRCVPSYRCFFPLRPVGGASWIGDTTRGWGNPWAGATVQCQRRTQCGGRPSATDAADGTTQRHRLANWCSQQQYQVRVWRTSWDERAPSQRETGRLALCTFKADAQIQTMHLYGSSVSQWEL